MLTPPTESEVWLDLARRSFAREEFEETRKQKGFSGPWKVVGPTLGLAKDPEFARRYMDLGTLDADTLGYRYRKHDPFFWLFTIALEFHLGWDFWPLLARPLEDVRRELGVPAL